MEAQEPNGAALKSLLLTGPKGGREEKESAVTLTYIRVAGCLCTLFLMSAPAMAGGWEHDYETALNRARASDRY